MTKNKSEILVVDDDPMLLKLLVDTLNTIGYKVDGVKNGEAALNALSEKNYDMVITDIIMPGLNGVALLEKIKKKFSIPVLFISGADSPPISGSVQPDGFIAKPFRISKIEESIQEFSL